MAELIDSETFRMPSETFGTRVGGTFWVDLNALRDGRFCTAMVGYHGPQSVPALGETVTAVDENGCAYDASVAAVMPDSRVYLELNLASRRGGMYPHLDPARFWDKWSMKTKPKSKTAV